MTRTLLAVFALLLPSLASAHDFWIEPSSFRPAPGERVAATLRVGEHLRGDPVARDPLRIERFVLKNKSAQIEMTGEAGDEPAGSAVVDGAGLHWIGYESNAAPIELEAKAFEAYLREEGLERIIDLRAKNGESDKDGRERYSRCAKSLIDAGRAGETPALLGFTLELVPRRSPYALRAGAELPVALLFRGKPVANVLVIALNGRDSVRARTDANGLVTLRLGNAGFWLIKAVHMERAPAGSGVEWESWWASMTFDLAAK